MTAEKSTIEIEKQRQVIEEQEEEETETAEEEETEETVDLDEEAEETTQPETIVEEKIVVMGGPLANMTMEELEAKLEAIDKRRISLGKKESINAESANVKRAFQTWSLPTTTA